MKWICVMVFFLSPLINFAQSLPNGSESFGKSGMKLFSGLPFSPLNNPASLNDSTQISFAVQDSRHFLLPDIRNQALSFNLEKKNQKFGLSFSSFGIPVFKTRKVAMAYGIKIHRKLSLGFNLQYLHTYTASGPGKSGIGTCLAHSSALSSKTRFSASVEVFSRDKLRLHSTFRFALCYEASPAMLLIAETSAGNESALQSIICVEIKLRRMRFFFSNDIGLLQINSGLYLPLHQHLQLLTAFSFHTSTGFAQSTDLHYRFK